MGIGYVFELAPVYANLKMSTNSSFIDMGLVHVS